MKPAPAATLAFVLASVAVFLAIAGGYIEYADSTHYFDREGATGMGVVFFYAPLGGIVAGILCAVLTFKIVSRRTR